MDHVLAVLITLLAWRMLTGIALGILIGAFFAYAFPSIAGANLFLFFFLIGVAFGASWQAAVYRSPNDEQDIDPPISKPVAFVGLSFIGLVWSGLIEFASGSMAVSMLTLAAAPFILGPIVGLRLKRRITLRQTLFTAIAFLIGPALIFSTQTVLADEAPNYSSVRTPAGAAQFG